MEYTHDYEINAIMNRGYIMRVHVTPDGLLIPKQFLEGIQEVEIRKEYNYIWVIPLVFEDPILQLGTSPVVTDEGDASVHHDRYLYQP